GLIIIELVSNALKHAFHDGRRGTLKVSLQSPAPGQVSLSVQDDGVGLPPGFDWDQARSLGLRMVRDLARQIRGTLEVRQNGGTTFALCFPVAKPRRKSFLIMNPPSILISEDEIMVARDLEQRLLKFGYQVADIVDTGEEAVQKAATLHPDLVLMDIRLRGEMDGVAAAVQIRSACKTPVIFVTAHA